MNCRQANRRLNAYLDGELSDEMSERVREHLQACPRCAGELARQRTLNRTLDSLPGVTAPVDFARSVRERAARQPVSVPTRRLPGLWRASPVAMRAAAMLAVGVGLLLGGFMSDSTALVRAAEQTAFADQAEADLSLELLSAVTPGSLAEAYLELTGESE